MNEITQPRWIGDQHRPEGDGWTGVTPADKDRAAGRYVVDRRTGDLVSAAANANTVVARHGSHYWTRRHGPAQH
jgi:hypothetical protein